MLKKVYLDLIPLFFIDFLCFNLIFLLNFDPRNQKIQHYDCWYT